MSIKHLALSIVGASGVALAAYSIQGAGGGCSFPEELKTLKFVPFHATGIGENYRAAVGFDGGDSAIVRRVRSRADANSAWDTVPDREFSLSFRITAVAHRDGGDVLYIAGLRESDCTDVIEKWTFPRRAGAYKLASRASPTTTPPVSPIGTTPLSFSLQQVVVGGGTYLPPAQRGGRLGAPTREVVYEGTTLGHIRSLTADPEGRFLLLQSHGNSGVYQIDLMQSPVGAPQLIADPSQYGALAQTTSLDAYAHPALTGRMFMMTSTKFGVTGPGAEWVVLLDDDNDGYMDAIVEFDESNWSSGPFADQSMWIEFVNEDGFEIDVPG